MTFVPTPTISSAVLAPIPRGSGNEGDFVGEGVHGWSFFLFGGKD